MIRFLAASVLALGFPLAALADPVIASVRGEVYAGDASVAVGERVQRGAVLITGRNSQAVLHLEEGVVIVLDQNSRLQIGDSRYQRVGQDRAPFSLLRGAARFITPATKGSDVRFELRTPEAILGVQGADFMVTLHEQLYIEVLEGSVAARNAVGTMVVHPGALGVVPMHSGATLVPTGWLPPTAFSAFARLESAPTTPEARIEPVSAPRAAAARRPL